MSWLAELSKVYDTHAGKAGIPENINGRYVTLLPLSHTSQTAHIEITINEDGSFNSAEVLDKVVTLIPTTEQSSSRSGKAVYPYPLHDKLGYVAGDLNKYGGGDKEIEQFSVYISQLKDWAESEYATEKIRIIYHYLSKKRLISDLVEEGILTLDGDQKLITKWNNKLEEIYGEKPKIFNKITGDIYGTFVRFNIYSPTKQLENIWEDTEQFNSFISYYNEHLGEKDICYVSGKKVPVTNRHANKIRNSGDKAKLISSNDTTWFTYKGRFRDSDEAATISYEVSQKAHNALKWLISRQATTIDGRVFLVWGNQERDLEIVSPFEDTLDIFGTLTKESSEVNDGTMRIFASEFRKALKGYRADLSSDANIYILILDAATPGRMNVQYYRFFDKETYFDGLEDWHTKCNWLHTYKYNHNSNRRIVFEGAPSPKDISFAAYGPKANEKITKNLMERILPCIIERRAIPEDIIQSCVNRAKNPVSMEDWEWRKTLSITCALLNHKEGTGVALNTETTNRSYLFGRLLAIVDHLEDYALYRQYVLDKSEDKNQGGKRQTSAQRLMATFSNRPLDTFENIYKNLSSYKSRLIDNGRKYDRLVTEIIDQFEFEDFNNKRLEGVFLQGYSSQMIDLRKKNEDNISEGENKK